MRPLSSLLLTMPSHLTTPSVVIAARRTPSSLQLGDVDLVHLILVRDLAERVTSGINPEDLAERVNSGTNLGDLVERVNSGTNPRDLAQRVNSGTNLGDLAEKVNSGTNPENLAEKVNSGTNPRDLVEMVNSGINLRDFAERGLVFSPVWGFRLDWLAHPITNVPSYLSEEEFVQVDRLKGILSSSCAIKEMTKLWLVKVGVSPAREASKASSKRSIDAPTEQVDDPARQQKKVKVLTRRHKSRHGEGGSHSHSKGKEPIAPAEEPKTPVESDEGDASLVHHRPRSMKDLFKTKVHKDDAGYYVLHMFDLDHQDPDKEMKARNNSSAAEEFERGLLHPQLAWELYTLLSEVLEGSLLPLLPPRLPSPRSRLRLRHTGGDGDEIRVRVSNIWEERRRQQRHEQEDERDRRWRADLAPWGSSRLLLTWDGIEGPDQRVSSFSHLFPTHLPRIKRVVR
ncbi:hypothetical protein BHE74_00027195 [Ensete ventricosum]|nr:hypothetical protein BHE74_00027195 [Ensete ventricosum]